MASVVHELDNDGLYEMRRRMGMMFQAGGLFSDMSVFDNIAFPMRELTDLPEDLIHDLVLMKLHAVGLRGTTGLMPSELSGGMARRVALARAIALDPMLAMYDEPFAGLDPISLNVIAELIRRLNDALGAHLHRRHLRCLGNPEGGRLRLSSCMTAWSLPRARRRN
jgi:phospholipid/cholesterol/gamma-HCH transport system ATP-binding protein